jgi:hypothetical protein
VVEPAAGAAQPLDANVDSAPSLFEGVRLPLADPSPQRDAAWLTSAEYEPRVAALHRRQSTPERRIRLHNRYWVRRPHAVPYLSCDVGELLRDVGKAFVALVVALLLLATVFIGWPVVAS